MTLASQTDPAVGIVSARNLGILAGAGSAALLGGALIFQALGYAPCTMCIWQRYPHVIAIGAGVAVFFLGPRRLLLGLGAIAALATSALGAFHTGVERGWWEGPTACSGDGGSLATLSGSDLLSFDNVEPVVLCTEVVWQLFGLSMASWNALASAGLVALWMIAFVMRSGRIA